MRAAIGLIPAFVQCPAVDAGGRVRDGAEVAEITDLLTLGGWPGGMRVIVRRERPLPSRELAINAPWLEASLTAMDLIAWAQTMLLDGELARAEPKKLRYRLLHTAARITRGQRRLHLRLARNWPWALALARAFTRLRLIPLSI